MLRKRCTIKKLFAVSMKHFAVRADSGDRAYESVMYLLFARPKFFLQTLKPS